MMPPATAALADWGMTLKGRIFAYCKYIRYAEIYNGFQYYISMPIYIIYYTYARTSRETPVGREPVCVEIFPFALRLFQWRSATGCTRGMYVYT